MSLAMQVFLISIAVIAIIAIKIYLLVKCIRKKQQQQSEE